LSLHRGEHSLGHHRGQLGYGPGSLPVAEEMAEQVCSLPIFPGIDDDQISAIAAAVADLTNRMNGSEEIS